MHLFGALPGYVLHLPFADSLYFSKIIYVLYIYICYRTIHPYDTTSLYIYIYIAHQSSPAQPVPVLPLQTWGAPA